MSQPNELERKVLNITQKSFPLCFEPYKEIGKMSGCTEEEVLEILRKFSDIELIKKVGAIIAPKKIGYKSCLAAMKVPIEKIEACVKAINKFEGVTHNYLRDGEPNLWFTMIASSKQELNKNIKFIEKETNIKVVKLVALKTYKIGVMLDI
ncbi:MAG: siroheme decarboxylase subunit alpha [Promethearchaeota archaeon]